MEIKARIDPERREYYTRQGWWGTRSLLDYWNESVRQYGERQYVCDDAGTWLTYAQIDEQAGRLASCWRASGMNPGDVVAIQLPNWSAYCMLKVKKEVEEGVEVIGVKFPCLVTYTKPAWDPRYPTIKRKMAANKAEIPVLGDDAFPDIDTSRIGLKGSPTNVKKTFVPQKKSGGVKIQEEDNAASAKKLFELLSGASII